METSILIVDDDRDFLEIMRQRLRGIDFVQVHAEEDPLRVAARFKSGTVYDLAMLDMTMPDMTGLELLAVIKEFSPATECIMVTAVNDAKTALDCLRQGAYDYLIKPVNDEDLALCLHRALEHKRLLDVLNIEKGNAVPRLKKKEAFEAIQTRSPRMLRVLKEAELHAASHVPILITGESGTGKELLAKAIHQASPRARFPFTAVNMASFSGHLFDAEFFGHTKGAFTGADTHRKGYLEHTHRGTLFLDEIGLLPQGVQGKLLRFLQDGQYLKLGTSIDQFADVRIIAATNADLDDLLAKGSFRKDLYYRIRGGWLHLPPLRQRKEDIPLLAKTFLQGPYQIFGSDFISPEAMQRLLQHDYPGNVRELKSILASAANLAQGGPLSVDLLPPPLTGKTPTSDSPQAQGAALIQPLMAVEKDHILKAYQQMGRNKSRTARALGIGLNTLRRKLSAFGET